MRRAARLGIRRLGFGILRISRFFEGAGRGLAYASFTPAELSALQESEWEAFGQHGPPEDLQLFVWEVELFTRHIRKQEKILVVGAGTGRDVFPLVEEGHEVTALDIAPRALSTLSEKAKALGRPVATIHASVAEAALPPSAFDVVLFSWFCFGYLRGARERRAALERCVAALRPGGRILISYQPREASDIPPFRALKLGRLVSRWIGGAEPEPGDAVNVTGSASRPSVFFSHRFAPGDIETEARAAGLEKVFQGEPASGVGVIVLAGESDPRR
jgi:SAM-dependent methyltransferase